MKGKDKQGKKMKIFTYEWNKMERTGTEQNEMEYYNIK